MRTGYALAPSNTVGNEAGSDFQPSTVGLMSLVALQFGLQPLLFKLFVREEVSGVSIVLATDLTKVLICLSVMWVRGSGGRAWRGWTLLESLQYAAVGIECVCELLGQRFIRNCIPFSRWIFFFNYWLSFQPSVIVVSLIKVERVGNGILTHVVSLLS